MNPKAQNEKTGFTGNKRESRQADRQKQNMVSQKSLQQKMANPRTAATAYVTQAEAT